MHDDNFFQPVSISDDEFHILFYKEDAKDDLI